MRREAAGSDGRSVTEAGVEEEEARGGTMATGERWDVGGKRRRRTETKEELDGRGNGGGMIDRQLETGGRRGEERREGKARKRGDKETRLQRSPNRRNIRLHQTSKHTHCVGLPVMSLLGGRGFRCNKTYLSSHKTGNRNRREEFSRRT